MNFIDKEKEKLEIEFKEYPRSLNQMVSMRAKIKLCEELSDQLEKKNKEFKNKLMIMENRDDVIKATVLLADFGGVGRNEVLNLQQEIYGGEA